MDEKNNEFFNKTSSSNQYQELKSEFDLEARASASTLNEMVRGNTLVVGGVWDRFEWGPQLKQLTVLDSSANMLSRYTPKGAKGVVGDLYVHDFPLESFDTVIFPLMLHHTAVGGWRSCEARIEQAVSRAHDWLKPGGCMLVYEHCPHRFWYPIQRALLPLTKLCLRLVGQPLVVMHSARFFDRLIRARFGSCIAQKIIAPGLKPWTFLPVFLAAPWIKLPFLIYPKTYIFVAAKK